MVHRMNVRRLGFAHPIEMVYLRSESGQTLRRSTEQKLIGRCAANQEKPGVLTRPAG
jgi:hypothetical protein